ncbi:nucleotidyltransferase family protein [Microbacterium allomyrinae]|uniref:Nucleotidyltransferase family protein n=1 Tax=Microbacterium allomyrinae TaxID=2830666 RepID=A0A9X1LW99_9MICO|nr:nucleotidyltransferase family protein [Microbacterium allomyrinae]MCC2033219.1 nucleotidyltransferase family protein [Microbacterium allomyrinae]
MTRPLNPAVRGILIELARFEPSRDSEVRSALRSLDPAEWGRLFELAGTHRVLANLSRIAAEMTDAPAPSKHLARRLLLMLKRQAAMRRWESQQTIAALRADGIDAAVLKGYVLGIECYPEFYLRETGDLDLLVEPDLLERAAASLQRQGFLTSQVVPATGELESLSPARIEGYRNELQHLGEFTRVTEAGSALTIDLHFRLSTVFDHRAPDTQVFLSHTADDVGGDYRRFAPELFVAHLAYHAWWDTQTLTNVRSGLDLRLFQYSDILLAFRAWDLTCGAVVEWAHRANVLDTATWALWMTSELFGGLAGDDVLDRKLAAEVDRAFTDRWLQRGTDSPIGQWDRLGPSRIFDVDRGAQATAMVIDWLDRHTKRGDVLTWIERD